MEPNSAFVDGPDRFMETFRYFEPTNETKDKSSNEKFTIGDESTFGTEFWRWRDVENTPSRQWTPSKYNPNSVGTSEYYV